MITAVIENIVLPLYLSYSPSWSSQQITVSPVMSQFLYTVISGTISRLMSGENTQSCNYSTPAIIHSTSSWYNSSQ